MAKPNLATLLAPQFRDWMHRRFELPLIYFIYLIIISYIILLLSTSIHVKQEALYKLSN